MKVFSRPAAMCSS